MGRRVYEQKTGAFVWKYWVGEQNSEQCRIKEEIGLGSYRQNINSDVLTISCTERSIDMLRKFVAKKYPKEYAIYASWKWDDFSITEADDLYSDGNIPFAIMCLVYSDYIESKFIDYYGKRLQFHGEF